MTADDDVAFAAARDLVRALRERDVSSSELLDLYLRRIDAFRELNAVVTLDERARGWAAERDAETARGVFRGALHGLPLTVKDSLETEGLRTTSGAVELARHVPKRDAVVVERLRAAGAVVFGKTNLPAWADDLQTDNEVFGATRNPWHADRSPGGSSGGAAAAVAAGLTGAEIGSDIGGSIRQPAANCGVFGLKPSFGVIPLRGHIPGPPGTMADTDVAAVGPIARSASDLELLLDAVAGPGSWLDAAWRLELPPARVDRVGWWFDDDDYPLDVEVRNALEAAATELGAEPVRPPVRLRDAMRLYLRLVAPALSRGDDAETISRRIADADGRDEPDVHSDAAYERWSVELHRDWLEANEERVRLQAAWADICGAFDAVLLPVTPVAAQPHQPEPTLDGRSIPVGGLAMPWRVLSPWLWVVGLLHLPGVAAPVGFTGEGLPIGVQVVGRFGGDRTAIEVGRRIGRYARPPLYAGSPA